MKIGAQLYTVRTFCQTEKDLGRTLEAIAKMGYEEVQISAIGPIPAKRVRALCDANGLKIVLTHNPEQKFTDAIDTLIEDHQTYGCKYVGLSMMSEKYRCEGWLEHFVEDFMPAAEKLHEAGMHFMYHNHAYEFQRLADGRQVMDALLDAFPAELMGVTADTYWIQYAGMDVNKWLRDHADRLPCVHFKDLKPELFEIRMAAVGQGNINFPDIIETLRHNGVTEHVLVEQDNCYGASPFACLKQSYDYLSKRI